MQQLLISGLLEWSESNKATLHATLYLETRLAVEEQQKIGWHQLWYGCLYGTAGLCPMLEQIETLTVL